MTVLIATKNRPAKLLRCLRSIPAGIAVAIHATGPEDISEEVTSLFCKRNTPLSVSWGSENIVESFNLLALRTAGDVLPVPDDVEFSTDFFPQQHAAVTNNPNRLVYGVHVTNREHNNDAVTYVKREFIQSRGFLFNPRFKHFFIDFEIGLAAKTTGVFHFCREATLKHHHPGVSGEYDNTHSHQRMEKWHHDKAIWDQIRGI